MIMTTLSSVLRLLVSELQTMDKTRAHILHVVQTLGGRYVTAPRSATPQLARKGRKRPLNAKLYKQTVGLVRASEQPVTTKQLRQELRKRRLDTASLYAHLGRAVTRCEVAKDARGRYSRPRPADTVHHKQERIA